MEATYGGVPLTGATIYEQLSEAVQTRGRALVDLVQPVQGRHARPVPRGNRSREVRIKLRRDYDSYVAAAVAAENLAEALPAQGALRLVEAGAEGIAYITHGDAVLAEWGPVTDGVAFKVELVFTCGAPPVAYIGAPPPAVRATWGTWHAAKWPDLNARKWSEQQLAA